MKIRIEDLQEGCIISENIYCGAGHPLVRKKTVVTSEIIDILKAFLIKKVRVERYLSDGTEFIHNSLVRFEQRKEKKRSFSHLFGKVAEDYHNEFAEWQSGLPVNISRIRSIIHPLSKLKEEQSLVILHELPVKYESFFEHSVWLTFLCACIGEALHFDKEEVTQLVLTACLCDCGMAMVPPGELVSLTTSVHNEFSHHPIYSYKMLKNNCLLSDEAKMAIIQHHERLDGSGYPFGNLYGKIHPFAKIIARADAFLQKNSSANSPSNPQKRLIRILEQIKLESRGKLDEKMLRRLLTLLRQTDAQQGQDYLIKEKKASGNY